MCALAGKPVIVATHLLESMIVNPLPTRAEVTDVANAVYEGADALMLSGETGAGVDPVRCVQVMADISRRIEKEPSLGFSLERRPQGLREELARSACRTADSLGAHAVVVISRRGLLAELVASFRPQRAIIYAFTDSYEVRQRLWLYRSVVPLITELHADPETTVRNALAMLRSRNRLLAGDPVVVISDVVALHERITSIQVRIFD
jgi:pyruvate kinase